MSRSERNNLPGGIPASAIIAADQAAREQWKSHASAFGRSPLVAVRFPPNRDPPVEFFVLAEPPDNQSAALFFAGALPKQIYAVAKFKCSNMLKAEANGKSASFFIISESDADRAVGIAKTAMRPIGCDITPTATCMTMQRVFAAEVVAPAAAAAFFAGSDL